VETVNSIPHPFDTVFAEFMLLTSCRVRRMVGFVMNAVTDPGQVRPPAVAGRFYPAQAKALESEVDCLLAEAETTAIAQPKALIAPHAGYLFSGPIAGTAFSTWTSSRQHIERVVLIGPSHYHNFPGICVSSAHAFGVPGGPVTVDRDAVQQLTRRGLVKINDAAHAPEHALEVELPFLQAQLPDFQIVPLLVGQAPGKQVAEVLDAVWGGTETVVVVSSDLSHYLDYASAREMDGETRVAIEELNPDPIDETHACGSKAIQGLLEIAKHRQLEVSTLDLRNSGDTAGPRDQVVGYGAWAFTCTAP
jgi:AmmeMemoRadiSam system protein B